jgi:hypothetical protein
VLIYHPAYDAYHCIFRLLTLMEVAKDVEVAKARILDFFLTFPAEVRNIRLAPALAGKKKQAKSQINIYRGPISINQVFRDMEQIQMAAIQALAASNIINPEKLALGFIERTTTAIPPDMLHLVVEKNQTDNPVIQFILKELSAFPLLGVDGLKHRTGLMEYRYDNA